MGDVGDGLGGAVRPSDRDRRVLGLAQAEMHPGVALGNVKPSAPDFVDLRKALGLDSNPGSDGRPARGQPRIHHQGAGDGRELLEQGRPLVHVDRDDFESPVVVEIRYCEPARGMLVAHARTRDVAKVVESPPAVVPVHQPALAEPLSHACQVHSWVDMAVSDEDVLEAVVVDVQEGRSPPEVLGVDGKSGGNGLVDEHLHALVQVEGVRVVREVGLEDVKVPVEVEVACRHAHARLLLAVHVVGGSRDHSDLLECAVALVVEEQAGSGNRTTRRHPSTRRCRNPRSMG